MIGTTEIVLIVLAILLLFGGKKIPELARGLGTALREFKESMDGKNTKKNQSKFARKTELARDIKRI